MKVKHDLDLLWAGYLGDGMGAGDPGSGCTQVINVPNSLDTYTLFVYSTGWVNGNGVSVQDDDSYVQEVWTNYLWCCGTDTQTVEISMTYGNQDYMAFNVYQAGAYALYRHNGGLSGEYFTYRTGPDIVDSEYDDEIIYIRGKWEPTALPHYDRKFIIVHEAGHRMADLQTDGVMNAAQVLMDPTVECPSEPAGAAHSMRSEEYNGTAAGEGFAHFYSADVWNDHYETDCWFHYWKQVGQDTTPVVDCEGYSEDFPTAFHREECGATNNHGVELDWLRTFWDMHATGSPSTSVGFNDIMEWLATADEWDEETVFDELNERADEIGDQLYTNWYGFSYYNGVRY